MRAFSFHQRVSKDAGLAGCGRLIARGAVLAMMFWNGVPTAHCQQEKRTPGDAVLVDDLDGIVPADFVCGPRCVQYLLKYYGQDVDLIELVREMQWPELEAGTSMDVIAEALNERGIHTFGMQLTRRARLTWPYPVLVHMKVEGGKLGHFVVRLPSSSETVDLWSGLAGVQHLSDDEFAERCTGAILLTGPEPIKDAELAIKRAGVPNYVWCMCFGSFVGVLLTLGIVRRRI